MVDSRRICAEILDGAVGTLSAFADVVRDESKPIRERGIEALITQVTAELSAAQVILRRGRALERAFSDLSPQ